MPPKKPTFLIIGSHKCGTTTLAAILAQHPDCCVSRPKEICFFQKTFTATAALMSFQPSFPKAVYSHQDSTWNYSKVGDTNPNFLKGWEWYRKAWSHYNGEREVGEASPDYSCRTDSTETASRIHAFNREMKIIYMVREPMSRMISHWQMWHRLAQLGFARFDEARWAKRGFEFYMISRERCKSFWDETRYHYQLEPYLKLFPRERVLVSFLEDWKVDQTAEVARILQFLNLDASHAHVSPKVAMNRATDTKKHTLLQRIVVGSHLRRVLRHITGPNLWMRLSKRYALAPILPTQPKVSKPTMTTFLDYIREDNLLFLKDWGKPSSYWAPEK